MFWCHLCQVWCDFFRFMCQQIDFTPPYIYMCVCVCVRVWRSLWLCIYHWRIPSSRLIIVLKTVNNHLWSTFWNVLKIDMQQKWVRVAYWKLILLWRYGWKLNSNSVMKSSNMSKCGWKFIFCKCACLH